MACGLPEVAQIEKLGVLLNYNSYGESEEDLFFPPAELHRRMAPYADPLAFIRKDSAYETLEKGYAEDMQRAANLKPAAARGKCGGLRAAKRKLGAARERSAGESPGALGAGACARHAEPELGRRHAGERARAARAACGRVCAMSGVRNRRRPRSRGRINHLPMEGVGAFTGRFFEHYRKT